MKIKRKDYLLIGNSTEQEFIEGSIRLLRFNGFF